MVTLKKTPKFTTDFKFKREPSQGFVNIQIYEYTITNYFPHETFYILRPITFLECFTFCFISPSISSNSLLFKVYFFHEQRFISPHEFYFVHGKSKK